MQRHILTIGKISFGPRRGRAMLKMSKNPQISSNIDLNIFNNTSSNDSHLNAFKLH